MGKAARAEYDRHAERLSAVRLDARKRPSPEGHRRLSALDAGQLSRLLSLRPRAIIFDFDGVLADSEVLSNTVLAEIVTELGVPTSVEDAYRDYMGKRFHEVIAAIEKA